MTRVLGTSTGKIIAGIKQAHPDQMIVFTGQSLLNVYNQALVTEIMAGISDVPYKNRGIAGGSWTALLNGGGGIIFPADEYTWPYFIGESNLLVLLGGTSDILFEGNTGAQTYADLVTFAEAARAAGADKVIAGTIPPTTQFNPTMEGYRVAHNALLMGAEGAADFDGVFDVSVAPLNDATNATYYPDGLHWSNGVYGSSTGIGQAAPIMRTAVLAAIA